MNIASNDTAREYADGKILTSVTDRVGILTFNNPEKRNAMSVEMWAAAGDALLELRDDPAVKVVVLVGAGGKAFVSGADISQFEKNRNNAAAIEFGASEIEPFKHFTERLLMMLQSSDFMLAFPGRQVLCTLHHHKQLWWTTTEPGLIESIDAMAGKACT